MSGATIGVIFFSHCVRQKVCQIIAPLIVILVVSVTFLSPFICKGLKYQKFRYYSSDSFSFFSEGRRILKLIQTPVIKKKYRKVKKLNQMTGYNCDVFFLVLVLYQFMNTHSFSFKFPYSFILSLFSHEVLLVLINHFAWNGPR